MASAYSSGAVVSAMVRMRAESGVRMPSATLAMDNERRGVSVLGNARENEKHAIKNHFPQQIGEEKKCKQKGGFLLDILWLLEECVS